MNTPSTASPATPVFTLRWLRLLRWTAVAGQTLTVLWVVYGLRLALPLPAVFACIGLTALTNLALQRVPAARGESPGFIAAWLAFDILLLTVLLHLTGGPHNPFTAFYLAHVALAAVVLPPLWTTLVAGLCSAGFGLLFLGRAALPAPAEPMCGVGPAMPLHLHLSGMFAAFVLTALAIVFFAARLQQALRRREADLAEARAAAARHERFAALATLAAGAAHELGTPLGTIVVAAGEVARVARGLPDQPDLADDAELIREEAARCRTILDRLESQSGDAPREIPVAEIAGILRARFPEGLEIDAAPGVTAVFAPPEAFLQALLSLVKNAFDASPGRAVVTCSIRPESDGVGVHVSDRGEGLSPEARIHAGEPFFTTKPQGRGTGLGLFLVRMLAERLGGEFRLSTATPGGTTATLLLPRAQIPR
jgi:two-component system sensor histidine kinase RegB